MVSLPSNENPKISGITEQCRVDTALCLLPSEETAASTFNMGFQPDVPSQDLGHGLAQSHGVGADFTLA